MAYGSLSADVITSSTGQVFSPSSSVMKNRIINGAMMVSQYNGTSSFTPVNNKYAIDRWQFQATQASKFTGQQNLNSVTPPVGFANYYGLQVSSAYSIGSGDNFNLTQNIEGYNTADLGWGTANAKTVTLSFQVYSSLTGTFGGSICNYSNNRSYPFTYTISNANTWTSIAITIPGDTTGTWAATNSGSFVINFGLGVGSTYSGTAGSWAGAYYISATGATSVVGTASATFYITGVQLEVGTVATQFEYRQYGTELALCQRYLPAYIHSSGSGSEAIGTGYNTSTTNLIVGFYFPVTARVPPTGITVISGSGSIGTSFGNNGAGGAFTAAAIYNASTSYGQMQWTYSSASSGSATNLNGSAAGTTILFTGCEL